MKSARILGAALFVLLPRAVTAQSPPPPPPLNEAGGLSSWATLLFYFLAFLCLFGYLVFNNYTLNNRLEQLSEALRQMRSARLPLVPFSWSAVLPPDAEGIGEPGQSLVLHPPGLYLLISSQPETRRLLAANAISQTLSQNECEILVVANWSETTALAHKLFALEAGSGVDQVTTADRKRMGPTLEKYERTLRMLEDNEHLAEALGQASADIELAALVMCNSSPATDVVDALYRASLTCETPILLLAATPPPHLERFHIALEVEQSAPDQLQIKPLKYPAGRSPASLELSPTSGRIRRK